MTLPVAIGKSSSNEPFVVDVEQLPHLFVSYTEEVQIRDFFSSLVAALSGNEEKSPIHFALALSRKYSLPGPLSGQVVKYYYSSNDEINGTIKSREKFILALAREMKQRSAILKKGRADKAGMKASFPRLVILLDDTFDIILSNKRPVAFTFLQLMLLGRELKMHVVAASSFTYRNLLKQLIQLNPLVKEKFKSFFVNGHFQVTTPIGAELVITAEDFLFFKAASALDYERLYPLSEKDFYPEPIIDLLDQSRFSQLAGFH